jgi:hypothetical protein
MQQDLQQHKLRVPNLNGPGPSKSEPVVVHEITVDDAVEQIKLELQMVQSRLRSDAASINGHVFKS